ncbi:MAG: hypothetical protein EA369_09360 [Bradymonadales bacterium]|nr:MAG: hypothetical protein EA369_09360 [Bradymonadales bacterium]
MSLSLEKILESLNDPLEIDLESESWSSKGSNDEELASSLEDLWAAFLFLKAVGFKKVSLRNPQKQSLRNWQKRIEEYQQHFIHDPEYLQLELCQWNESSESNPSELAIECWPAIGASRSPTESRVLQSVDILEMKGPRISADAAVLAFREEVETFQASDILRRMLSILREFKFEKSKELPAHWPQLIGSVLRVAIENSLLGLAQDITQEYQDELQDLWKDESKVTELLKAYEARPVEFHQWAEIFRAVDIQLLIRLLERELGGEAGPQIIKLMTYRAEREHESLIEICLELKPATQRLLLQWLAPYWKPKHYPIAIRSLQGILETGRNLDLVNSWVQALLLSYRAQALADLKAYLKPDTSLWRKLFKRKSVASKAQRSIIQALADSPSSEILQFLKELRPSLQGEVADEAEKVLQNFRSLRWGSK